MQLLTLRHGDCVARMAAMPEGSVDAIVCDPPYGLEFQGAAWDAPWKQGEGDNWRTSAGMSKVGLGGREIPWPSFAGGDAANATCATCGGRMRGAKKCACDQPEWRVKGKPLGQQHTKTAQMRVFGQWSETWLREAYRVLKAGGTLYAFGGTRTHHRLSKAMVAVGFTDLTIRAWGYATGFPKSMNVALSIDKAARGTPQGSTKGDPLKRGRGTLPSRQVLAMGGKNGGAVTGLTAEYDVIYTPVTDDARQWQGYGTALRPSWEPVVCGKKP